MSESPGSRPFLIFFHGGFILTGAVTTLLGPLLPVLAQRWHMTDAQSGILIAVQFSGATAANAVSGILGSRFGIVRVMAAGYALMAAGVAGLAPPLWIGGLAAVLCYGMGFGLTVPTTNVAVSELNPGRRAAALNIVNVCWGFGAVAAAPVVAFCRGRGWLAFPQAALIVLLASVSAWLAWHGRFAAITAGTGRQPAESIHESHGAIPWMLAALGFLYVGTETAVGGWATSYAQRLSTDGAGAWAIPQSSFWGALIAGRAVAPAVLRRLSPERLVFCSLILTTLGVLLLLTCSGIPGLTAAVAVTGFGLAAIFPTLTGIYTAIMGSRAMSSAGGFFVLSSFGGALLPALVGVISTQSGALRLGMLVPVAATAGMIAIHSTVMSRLHPKTRKIENFKASN